MNNLFLFLSILFLICFSYGFGSPKKGTVKDKNGVGKQSLQKVNGILHGDKRTAKVKIGGGKQSFQETNGNTPGKPNKKSAKVKNGGETQIHKANGIIQMKDSSNKIPMECCECLCDGNTHEKATRVKRSICEICFNYTNNILYCDNCIYTLQRHTDEQCTHCSNTPIGNDLQGNPACADHLGEGDPENNDEREETSPQKCVYENCYNRATGRDYANDPVCSAHNVSADQSQSACSYSDCQGTVIGTDFADDPVCKTHQECTYCTNTAIRKNASGYRVCADHYQSGGGDGRATVQDGPCVYSNCEQAAIERDMDNDLVCKKHYQCSYCTKPATTKDRDNDRACAEHENHGGN